MDKISPKILLIRHAESENNSGKVIPHDNIVKITEKGRLQAIDLSNSLSKPDKIICSKFIRTIETAEPLIKKYPDVETHIWINIHEFQPINLKSTQDLTLEQKIDKFNNYWNNNDPLYKYDKESESFKDFIHRVAGELESMKNLKGSNYIFTHGNFIRCALMLTEYNVSLNLKNLPESFYVEFMKKFQESHKKGTIQINNIDTFDISKNLKKFNIINS